MSFLYPLMWLGAIGILVPLWLHFQHRPDQDVVRFSAVQFLQDQPEPRRSPMRPRNLFLLAVRLFCLLLIVAAFAWPYIRPKATEVVAESRVYILDNTMSQQVDDRFTRDRDRLREEVRKAPPLVQVAVIELTSSPKTIIHFSDSRQTADEKLANLKPSYERGSFLAAFRSGASLLDQALGLKKSITMISDSQENQWDENTNVSPFIKDVDVSLSCAETGKEKPNLYLNEVTARRMFMGKTAHASVNFVLGKLGPADHADVTVSANKQKIFERSVQFSGEAVSEAVSARWESDPSMWIEGEISIDGTPDSLPADNRVFFSLPPVEERHVAFIGQSPFLRTALSPEVGAGYWSTRFLDPAELSQELVRPERSDVLIIESKYLHSKDARELVLGYLNNGNGVILVLNQVTPVVTHFLRDIGFDMLTPQRVERRTDAPAGFVYMLAEHPILAPFLAPDFGDLSKVSVYEYARLRSTVAMPLLFSKDGDCLLFEGTKTKGKLLLIPFGLDRKQTNWPLQPTFVPFLDLCMQQVRSEGAIRSSLEPGEMWNFSVPPARTVREVVLHNGEKEISRTVVGANGRAEIRMPREPGLYGLTYDGGNTVEQMVAVNPAPRESLLKYTPDPQALKTWKVSGETSAPAPAAVAIGPLKSSVFQQRYWWWLVLAALGFLAIETSCLFFARRA